MKDSDIKSLERVFRALGNRRRLQIVQYLRTKKHASVGEIAERINLSFTSTSRHLGIMEKADVLDKNQSATIVYYSLTPGIERYLSGLF